MDDCNHKFVDSGYCLKCGRTRDAIKADGHDEALELLRTLRAELDAAESVLVAVRQIALEPIVRGDFRSLERRVKRIREVLLASPIAKRDEPRRGSG